MFLKCYPTSRNDLHLFSLYRHVLSCACVCLCVWLVRAQLWVCHCVHMSKEQWAVVSLLLCMWRHVLCLCVSLCTGATAGTNVAFACCFPRLVRTSAVPVDRSQTTLIALVCVCTPWPGAVSVCVCDSIVHSNIVQKKKGLCNWRAEVSLLRNKRMSYGVHQRIAIPVDSSVQAALIGCRWWIITELKIT